MRRIQERSTIRSERDAGNASRLRRNLDPHTPSKYQNEVSLQQFCFCSLWLYGGPSDRRAVVWLQGNTNFMGRCKGATCQQLGRSQMHLQQS